MGITPPPALLQAVPIIVPPPSQPNTENTPLTRPARIVGGGAGLLPPPLVSINQGSQAHLAASQMASIMASQSQATPPATGPGAPGMPAGMFMGDIMMPIPEHLATKILSLQYIDMSELRPEAWLFEDEPAENLWLHSLKGAKSQSQTYWCGCNVLHLMLLSWYRSTHSAPLI